MDVGLKIKKYLEEKGIKQTYVAKKMGYKIKSFNLIVNGKTRVTTDFLLKICSVLEKDPKNFLE